jgi:4-carboxymuconolactone decarboxylase
MLELNAACPNKLQRFSIHIDKERAMDKQLMDAGLGVRREVLGDEYVDRAMKNADDFNKPFQEVVSEYCWGLCWSDETLSRRERSILNLGMIAALGKMHEFELHLRGAIRNGLTKEELRAVLIQIAVYCGIPVGVDCFRTAKQVIGEMKP